MLERFKSKYFYYFTTTHFVVFTCFTNNDDDEECLSRSFVHNNPFCHHRALLAVFKVMRDSAV